MRMWAQSWPLSQVSMPAVTTYSATLLVCAAGPPPAVPLHAAALLVSVASVYQHCVTLQQLEAVIWYGSSLCKLLTNSKRTSATATVPGNWHHT